MTTTRLQKIWMAVRHVRRARDLLRMALCKPAADTLARALKSVEGAERHAKLVPERNLRIAREAAKAIGAARAAGSLTLADTPGGLPSVLSIEKLFPLTTADEADPEVRCE